MQHAASVLEPRRCCYADAAPTASERGPRAPPRPRRPARRRCSRFFRSPPKSSSQRIRNTMAATSTTSVTRRRRCGPGYSTNAVSHGVTAMPTNVIAPPPRAAPTTPPRTADRLDSDSCLASSLRSPDPFSVPVAGAMTSTIARSARSRRDLCHTAAVLADAALAEPLPGGRKVPERSASAAIGAPGFEPGTSPTRTVRATRLRHAPMRGDYPTLARRRLTRRPRPPGSSGRRGR
jgi:hypothetical protein